MMIRRFKEKDAQAVSDLIAATLRTTNRKDYSEEYLEKIVQRLLHSGLPVLSFLTPTTPND